MKKVTLELQNALDKELSLMKNDFYYQQIEIERNGLKKIVRIDTSFNPLDVLGGDSYSIRKTEDGKVVFFILDAMGKGISASITAATSASLLNYIFDQMKTQGNFEFERWIKRYVDFVKNELLENEMLAIFFACYDKHIGMFNHASFGMPASLIETCEGEFIKAKSNNAPINRYTDDFSIETVDAKKLKKALFYTDGLCETALENGKFYKDSMYKDFIDSENFVDFNRRVNSNIATRDDDILYLYMEHGIFGIDRDEKNRLIEKGKFDDTLVKFAQEHKDKEILVSYVVKEEGGSKILIARIEDGGDGFDTKILRKLAISPQHFNGRGIMIVKKLLDRFYYNEKGNAITIRKFLN